MRLTAILAMDRKGVIGKDNSLPWHLSADLKRFRQLSMGKPIVMGRKTHESIGRALPGRRNIVISRQPNYRAEGCEVRANLEQALDLLEGEEEVLLIGGAQLLADAIHRCSRFLLTWVDAEVEGDVNFPPPDFRKWQPVVKDYVPADEKNQYAHYFFDLRRSEALSTPEVSDPGLCDTKSTHSEQNPPSPLLDWRPPWTRR